MMNEKILDKITYIVLVLFLSMIAFFIYISIEMWRDHLCYVDGQYNTPECKKYIRGDE